MGQSEDCKLGQFLRTTNRGRLRDFKSDQKDYKLGQKVFKSGQERLQTGAGISNRGRYYKSVQNNGTSVEFLAKDNPSFFTFFE